MGFQLVFTKFHRSFPVFIGFIWSRQVSRCFNRFYRVLLRFTGFYWVLLRFTAFYRVLLGFTGFYWDLLGFTGFYWVLLGFTGFYWLLIVWNADWLVWWLSQRRERP